jgi:hypothetical protein
MTETSLVSNTDEIRQRFDAVLRDNIRRLLDTMPEASSLPFDIVTITSLILLVERENEIRTHPESTEVRYSEKTLANDLVETGIDMDGHSESSLKNLAPMGFVTIDEDKTLIPRDSTPKLVAVLDNLFPGMPGMNLVAYFLQTLQEAVTGRKDVEAAINQFEQTLFTRGVSLSKLNKSTGSNGKSNALQKEPEPTPEDVKAGSQRRNANMQRLREMRSSRSVHSERATHVKSVTPTHQPEIKALFPPSAAAPESAVGALEDVENSSISPDTEGNIETEKTAEKSETDTLEPLSMASPDIQAGEVPAEPDIVDTETDQTDANASDTTAEEENGDAVISSPEAFDEPIDIEPPSDFPEDEAASIPSDATDTDTETVKKEDVVDEKVQAFQEYLAMTCPFCREGKVLAAETEKGKTYYSCENTECNFISWGKPYHFSCPYCQNPFLVEFNTHDGICGLQCPKSTCNFRQDHLESPFLRPPDMPPHPNPAMSTSTGNTEFPVKKRKKLVRKRLVRRKR